MRPRNNKHDVLEFIKRYVASNNYAPTMAEIGRHFNWRSSSTVHDMLSKLEGDGLIKRTPNISRGIEIVQQPINAS